VPHTDAKGAMDYVFRDLGVPTTFLLTSFYWENLIDFGMGPQRTPEGLVFALPMSDRKLPGIAAEELANMFQFKQECNDEFRAVRDVTFSRELNPALMRFDQWLAQHGHRLAVTVPLAAAFQRWRAG
jgi:hypothetical protein